MCFAGSKDDGLARWLCKCTCGASYIVFSKHLRDGTSKGCGCKKRERIGKANTKHGHFINRVMSPEYVVWQGMKARCKDEHNRYYGSKGIKVCLKWKNDFTTFLEDMGQRPGKDYTLHRLDNKKGYSKSNCVWATWDTQANSRSNNRLITYNGKTRTLSQWAKQLNIGYDALKQRLNHGWALADAFSGPIRLR